MVEISYDYAPVPTVKAFAQSNAFIRGLLGPFGSGKSSGCVIEMIRRAQGQLRSTDGIRHSRWGVIRNTYSELQLTTTKTVFQWLPQAYCGRYIENKHTYNIKCFPGVDMEIVFLALDRPDDVAKLLSLELTGAWLNEAREIPWAIVDAIQGRVGRYPRRADAGDYWSGIWMDTNPPDSDSKWFRFFEEKGWEKDFRQLQRDGIFPPGMKPEEYAAIFKQPAGDGDRAENLINLPKGYYQKLAIGKSDEWKKIYVRGDYGFVVEGKLVYPEYVDRVHCKAVDPIEGPTIIRSWDFGLTPACIFSQVLPDGRWLTFDEMTSDNMSIDQFSDDVLEHCQRSFQGKATFEDWADPAGTQRAQTDKRTCFEIMEAKKIAVEGSEQDPTMRQEAVRSVLRRPGPEFEGMFVLHPRCKVLRKGFMGGYHRRRLRVSGAERYSAEPEKNLYSHPHDALQYAMVKYFAPSLRGIEPADDYPSGDDDYGDNGTGSESTTGY